MNKDNKIKVIRTEHRIDGKYEELEDGSIRMTSNWGKVSVYANRNEWQAYKATKVKSKEMQLSEALATIERQFGIKKKG